MAHISVKLHNPYCTWHTNQQTSTDGARPCQVWVRGQAWDDDTFLQGSDLAPWLVRELADPSVPIETAFENALCRLNGHFALVVQTPDQLLAAVDRLRSIPLFYGTQSDKFLLSDDPYHVRRFVGDTDLDDMASEEFLLTGYVTGADTLSPNVKQVQAGEYLHRADRPGAVLNAVRYYRFLHGDYFRESELALNDLLEKTLLSVFDRFVRSIGRSRIVVPLSGGLDSRLIVTMLKLMGVDDVMCFSYGRPGNWESAISQRVAERLGYEWHFVPYTRRRWRQWFRSDERQNYTIYGGTLVSIPILQDWAAIWELKRVGHLHSDDVLVPGHTGDVIAGGHIPRLWAAASAVKPEDTVDAILKHHYVLWNWRPGPDNLETLLSARVADRLEAHAILDTVKAAGAFEKWEWQERQAKFIANNARAYEFWGYNWRYPLWDHGLMSFFERVPLELRVGKRLWDSYLETRPFPRFGIEGLEREFAPRYGTRSTPQRGRLGPFAGRLWSRWYRMTSPYLGRYSVLEGISAWQGYGSRFGHHWGKATARRFLNPNIIHADMILRSLGMTSGD